MSEIHWVKLSTGMIGDEKISIIEGMKEGPDICWVWIKLLCLAGRVNDKGRIYIGENIPYDENTLSSAIHRPPSVVGKALQVLSKMGMVEVDAENIISLVNWEKHQNVEGMERVRLLDRERQRKLRESKKLLSRDTNVTVTPGHAIDSDSDSDSDSDKEKRREENTGPAQRTEPDPKVYYDFVGSLWYGITDEQVSLCAQAYPAVDIDMELRQMGEWCKTNGARGHKSNWTRFIINWLKRSQDRGGSQVKRGRR